MLLKQNNAIEKSVPSDMGAMANMLSFQTFILIYKSCLGLKHACRPDDETLCHHRRAMAISSTVPNVHLCAQHLQVVARRNEFSIARDS